MISGALKIVCVALVFQGCLSDPVHSEEHEWHEGEINPEPVDTTETEHYPEDQEWVTAEVSEDLNHENPSTDENHENPSTDEYETEEQSENNNYDETVTNPEVEAPLEAINEEPVAIDENPEENLTTRDLKATIRAAREKSKKFTDDATNEGSAAVTGANLANLNYDLAADLSKLQKELIEEKHH